MTNILFYLGLPQGQATDGWKPYCKSEIVPQIQLQIISPYSDIEEIVMYFFYSQCSTQESTTCLNQTVRMKKSYSLKNRSLRNRQPVRSDTEWIHKIIPTIIVFQDQCWFILYTFTLLNFWGKYCTFYLHYIYLIIIVTLQRLQSGDYRQVRWLPQYFLFLFLF